MRTVPCLRTDHGRLLVAVVAFVAVLALLLLGGCAGAAGGSDGPGTAGAGTDAPADAEPGGCDLSDLIGGEEAEAVPGEDDTTEAGGPADDTEPCLETPPTARD